MSSQKPQWFTIRVNSNIQKLGIYFPKGGKKTIFIRKADKEGFYNIHQGPPGFQKTLSKEECQKFCIKNSEIECNEQTSESLEETFYSYEKQKREAIAELKAQADAQKEYEELTPEQQKEYRKNQEIDKFLTENKNKTKQVKVVGLYQMGLEKIEIPQYLPVDPNYLQEIFDKHINGRQLQREIREWNKLYDQV